MGNVIRFDEFKNKLLEQKEAENAEEIRNEIYMQYMRGGIELLQAMFKYVVFSIEDEKEKGIVAAELIDATRDALGNKTANELITRIRESSGAKPIALSKEFSNSEIAEASEMFDAIMRGEVMSDRWTTEDRIKHLNALAICAAKDEAVLGVEKQELEYGSGFITVKDGVELVKASTEIGLLILYADEIKFINARLKDETTAVIIEYRAGAGIGDFDRITKADEDELEEWCKKNGF